MISNYCTEIVYIYNDTKTPNKVRKLSEDYDNYTP